MEKRCVIFSRICSLINLEKFDFTAKQIDFGGAYNNLIPAKHHHQISHRHNTKSNILIFEAKPRLYFLHRFLRVSASKNEKKKINYNRFLFSKM